MSANILIKMYKKCQENEELKFFFNGYVECLISGETAMYWNIEDKNNLQIIKDFFAELYQDCPQLYQINDWFVPNNTRKEYVIKWYHSLEEAEASKN